MKTLTVMTLAMLLVGCGGAEDSCHGTPSPVTVEDGWTFYWDCGTIGAYDWVGFCLDSGDGYEAFCMNADGEYADEAEVASWQQMCGCNQGSAPGV